MSIDARLGALGYTLPPAPAAQAVYAPVRQAGNVLYVSGQLPLRDGEVACTGALGGANGVAYGREAAVLCALNLLAAVKAHVGNLDDIKQIVKLTVMVSSMPGFSEQHLVANGASELLVAVFGPAGCGARSAIGVAGLPRDASVEIEAILEV